MYVDQCFARFMILNELTSSAFLLSSHPDAIQILSVQCSNEGVKGISSARIQDVIRRVAGHVVHITKSFIFCTTATSEDVFIGDLNSAS